MDNTWTYLEEGANRGVPVSPYLDDYPAIVHPLLSECHGRRRLDHIQERRLNGEWVSRHLPENAPLITFRVITGSPRDKSTSVEDVTALSCVFRAGRKNAATDHDYILFDVDVKTGSAERALVNQSDGVPPGPVSVAELGPRCDAPSGRGHSGIKSRGARHPAYAVLSGGDVASLFKLKPRASLVESQMSSATEGTSCRRAVTRAAHCNPSKVC
ncbi:hypothetical protein ACHAXT_011300 [Thalassiosira profunda]